MQNQCKVIDLDILKAMEITPAPFPYAILSNTLRRDQLSTVQQDYPAILDAGSFPLSAVQYGSGFARLIEDLHSDAFRAILAEKFQMDLSNKPVMITVRGKADHTDGRIHKDNKTKLITVLLYMNEDWQPDGGRLRLLHDNHNLDNFFAEVSPSIGTMLIFKVTDNGWHGHKPFIGTRKVIQLNYVTDDGALNKHALRHKISATFKALKRKLLGTKHECTHC